MSKYSYRIDTDLVQYIETCILPEYLNFDKGHSIEHIKSVTQRSFDLVEENALDVDPNMVFCVASFHDIGMKIDRKNHPLHSREILLNDSHLKNWFSGEQIAIMADAVEDHSTSSKNSARSIYGKIVSDADKDLDVNTGILRGWNYSISHYPENSFEQHIDNIAAEMQRRFCIDTSGNCLVKFYFPSKAHEEFIKNMRNLAQDKKLLTEKIRELLHKN